MKKMVLLLAALSISVAFSIAQQVPRNLVVLEIGTGTWCQYCPAASNGAEQLLTNGYNVAVVKYHNGDDYANVYSNARNSYYGISGFPTAFFDGLNPIVGGGGAGETMFPQYLARVNQRLAIQSSFTIGVQGTHTCLTNFTANVTVNKVATNTSTNLRLHAVLTEKHIPKIWQGMTEVNHACRLMVPNQNGTTVNFTSGNTQQYNLQFTLDPTWVFENMELVVFLQDQSTKEIFQASKILLTEFTPEYTLDAGVKLIDSLPKATCNGVVSPRVKFRNYGSNMLNSLDIKYQVNNGTLSTYQWNGAIEYLQEATVALPAITFDVITNNEITVYTENPNGSNDQCPANDAFSFILPAGMTTPAVVKFYLRTDANPQETTWEIKNSTGAVLYSGGPYSTSGQIMQFNFELPGADCYTFNVFDSGGDGLLSPGNVILYYGSNVIIYQGRSFGFGATTEFNVADNTGIESPTNENWFSVFPNPVHDMGVIELNLFEASEVQLSLLSLTGQELKRYESRKYNAGLNQISFDTKGLGQGVYILSIQIGNRLFRHRVIVVK